MVSHFKWITDILCRGQKRTHFKVSVIRTSWMCGQRLFHLLCTSCYTRHFHALLLCQSLWTTLHCLYCPDSSTAVKGASLPKITKPKVRTWGSLGSQTSKIIPTSSTVNPVNPGFLHPVLKNCMQEGRTMHRTCWGKHVCMFIRHPSAQIQLVLMQDVQYIAQSFQETLAHDSW